MTSKNISLFLFDNDGNFVYLENMVDDYTFN